MTKIERLASSEVAAAAPLEGGDGMSPAPVVDMFTDDRKPGQVVGSINAEGVARGGRDVERQIGIDHGALRFQHLITPGWGRQGIAYGPFEREHGLTFAVSVANGHNTAQGGPIPERLRGRIKRWALGLGTDPLVGRMLAWLRAPRKYATYRRVRWWRRTTKTHYDLPDFNENLAVGFFTSEAPANPLADGCGFILHAAEGENGEPWVRVGKHCLSAFRRLKNIRVCYVVSLRKRGAVYYASAVDGAHAIGGFPMMRPIAIDPFNDDRSLYAGIHQCAHGQIGWRADTRVHGVRIERMPEFASQFGMAQAGDVLVGQGALTCEPHGRNPWVVLRGGLALTAEGATRNAPNLDALAIVRPAETSGLVHALIRLDDKAASAGLVWRARDANNFWSVEASASGCALFQTEGGARTRIAQDSSHPLTPGVEHSLQILDSDHQTGCYLDGVRLFDNWFHDPSLEGERGAGLWLGEEGTAHIRAFEAHPRRVPMPGRLAFAPAWCRLGGTPEIVDDFAGPAGDLAGHRPKLGGGTWERTRGKGAFDLTGEAGGCIRASLEHPHPGRSFYTLPWRRPDFADLEMTITPPGERRGQGHNCRCGFVFWQDRANFISMTTWMLDDYDGASISVFPKRHGFEELYDAVWTMVADKITWGKPFRLRISFDGNNFFILIDGEPIMQRALTDIYPKDRPMRINRVGIAVNWEWGNDTGSTFADFMARA